MTNLLLQDNVIHTPSKYFNLQSSNMFLMITKVQWLSVMIISVFENLKSFSSIKIKSQKDRYMVVRIMNSSIYHILYKRQTDIINIELFLKTSIVLLSHIQPVFICHKIHMQPQCFPSKTLSGFISTYQYAFTHIHYGFVLILL